METRTIAGKSVSFTEDGYMSDMHEWNEDIAKELAKEENIELDDLHWKVLGFLREKQAAGVSLTIRSVGKSGIVDIKGFYTLFPGGPLKLSTKIAGLPKPASCV
ncbi:MAG: sulfur relay protein DsrC [Marinilabiliales bacterium]|nr:MAG: sulfur relay protein DsrC [Marinilabiliales bacterium]